MSKNVRNPLVALIVLGFLFWANIYLIQKGFCRYLEADFIRNTWLGGQIILQGHSPYDPDIWQAAKEPILAYPGRRTPRVFPTSRISSLD
ncbi:MAG: hypothetical protein MUO62_13085 [Anaerolineales bacterium]|nr:hypothetical protein [Anaerolineales bacterium]